MKKKKQVKGFQSKEIKKSTYMNEDYKMIITLIIVLIIIGIALGGLYFLNGKFVSKDQFQNTTTTTKAEPSYDDSTIMVSDILKSKKKDFYVLLYDTTDDTNAFLYDSLIMRYKGTEKIYKVDLSKAMNKKYYDKNGKENKEPKKTSDIMITRPTLMHIKEGKVIEYIVEKEKIVEKLS